MSNSPDLINPYHYKALSPEPIDVIESWQKHWPADVRYHLATAVKYLARCGLKHESAVEDLEKAQWFLSRAIGQLLPTKQPTRIPQTENPNCADRGLYGDYQPGDCSTCLAEEGWQNRVCPSCRQFYKLPE